MPKDDKDYLVGIVEGGENPKTDSEGCYLAGSYVYFRKFAGIPIRYDGVEYLSMDKKEILAVATELA